MNPAIYIAVAVAAQRRKVVRAFQDAAATNAATTLPVDQFGRSEQRHLRTLVAKGAIKETRAGRYYLDQARYEEWQQEERQRGLIVIAVITVASLVLYLIMRS